MKLNRLLSIISLSLLFECFCFSLSAWAYKGKPPPVIMATDPMQYTAGPKTSGGTLVKITGKNFWVSGPNNPDRWVLYSRRAGSGFQVQEIWSISSSSLRSGFLPIEYFNQPGKIEFMLQTDGVPSNVFSVDVVAPGPPILNSVTPAHFTRDILFNPNGANWYVTLQGSRWNYPTDVLIDGAAQTNYNLNPNANSAYISLPTIFRKNTGTHTIQLRSKDGDSEIKTIEVVDPSMTKIENNALNGIKMKDKYDDMSQSSVDTGRLDGVLVKAKNDDVVRSLDETHHMDTRVRESEYKEDPAGMGISKNIEAQARSFAVAERLDGADSISSMKKTTVENDRINGVAVKGTYGAMSRSAVDTGVGEGAVIRSKTGEMAAMTDTTVLDVVSPEVEITNLEDNQEIKGRLVGISVKATDKGGVEKIVVTPADSAPILCSVPSGTVLWDINGLSDGRYKIEATATDKSGNVGSTKISISIKNETASREESESFTGGSFAADQDRSENVSPSFSEDQAVRTSDVTAELTSSAQEATESAASFVVPEVTSSPSWSVRKVKRK